MPNIELTDDEIERLLAHQWVYYLHVSELVRTGQTWGPAFDTVEQGITAKLDAARTARAERERLVSLVAAAARGVAFPKFTDDESRDFGLMVLREAVQVLDNFDRNACR